MRGDPDRGTRSIRSHAGALLALILVAELTLGATAGAAEPATPKCDVNASPSERQLNRQLNRQLRTNPCPPGQRIEVAFGDTSLLIDPAWLQSITWLNDQTGCLCPEEAVTGFRYLQIFNPPLPARHLFVERGLPHYIRIREARPSDPPPGLRTNPSSRRYLPGGGFIEDVTDNYSSGRTDTMSRSYRLQLPATPTDPDPASFRVNCGGVPGPAPEGRWCTAGGFRYGDDIIVRYRFRQDRHGHRDERWPTPDGTISEPDGFLAMAARLRAWFDEIRKN